MLLAIPFLYYFRTDTAWLNRKIDLLGGLAAGLLLTLVQSTHLSGSKSRMFLHGTAMMVAFSFIMLDLRYVINIGSWGFSILFTLILTLFASLIIVLIEYREMYRRQTDN